ncbi:MAG: hypothetical protein ACP5N1_03530 [Candidatus Woesearchaeota archaeon]
MSKPTIKINLDELIILGEITPARGMSPEDALRVEEIEFTAYHNNAPIGHITTYRYILPTEKQSKSEFFTDMNFIPPRPRPGLLYMGVEDQYKGNGVSGFLIKFANEFYKSKYETTLHSGTQNSPEAIRVWEKLASCGDAVEYVYDKKRRWRLI